MTREDPLERIRRRGRRIGIAVFGVLVASFTIVCSAQIILQTWPSAAPRTDVDCRSGLVALIEAVRRARQAAAAETGGERAALARFRAALQPEWSYRPSLEQRCRPEKRTLRALEELDRLVYAEEHAVRYEAIDLARRRRRVKALEETLRKDEPPSIETRD
jgi:hypothetical protein